MLFVFQSSEIFSVSEAPGEIFQAKDSPTAKAPLDVATAQGRPPYFLRKSRTSVRSNWSFMGPTGAGAFLLKAVGLLDDDEDHESDDEKVDDRVEEDAVIDGRDPGRLRRRKRLSRFAGEIDEEAREINISEEQADLGA